MWVKEADLEEFDIEDTNKVYQLRAWGRQHNKLVASQKLPSFRSCLAPLGRLAIAEDECLPTESKF